MRREVILHLAYHHRTIVNISKAHQVRPWLIDRRMHLQARK